MDRYQEVVVNPEAFTNAVWDFIQTLQDDDRDTLFLLKTGAMSVYFHLDEIFDRVAVVNEQAD